MKIELVVLDMAGTTVYDGDAVNTCLRDALLGVTGRAPTRDAINRWMGVPKRIALDALLDPAHDTDRAALIEEVLADFERRMAAHYRASPDVREAEGAAGLFAFLRGHGIRVALDTGFSRNIADVLLARLGWDRPGVVDATITSNDVAAGRPAPDMVYRAMALTGVADAANVAKVGDTPSDLGEGTNAGCGMVVGVTGGTHTEAELRAHPHTALVPDLWALRALIEGRVGPAAGRTRREAVDAAR